MHPFLSDNEEAIQHFRGWHSKFLHARGELDEASEVLSDELTHNLVRIQDVVNTALEALTKEEKEDGFAQFLPTAVQWVPEWKRGVTDPEFQITEFSDEQVVILVNPPRGHTTWPRHFLETKEVKISTLSLSLTDDAILEAVTNRIEETRSRRREVALEKSIRENIVTLQNTISKAQNDLQEANDQLQDLLRLRKEA